MQQLIGAPCNNRFVPQEDMDRMDALKLAVLLNLALCASALGEQAEAIAFCDKALGYSPGNAKVYFRWLSGPFSSLCRSHVCLCCWV